MRNQGEIIIEGEAVQWQSSGDERQPASQQQVIDIRTHLAMVFQQFNLWSHMTILQNVCEAPIHVLGRERTDIEQEAMTWLDKVRNRR